MEREIVVVGSGICGTLAAHLLAGRGQRVRIFEKGPEYPYPHQAQFVDEVIHEAPPGKYALPMDLQNVQQTGNYRRGIDRERFMLVGGCATRWGAMTDRMHENDFRARTRYGYGTDWPLQYRDLEPHYSEAEELLGVSGSDEGDPYRPWRSRPYPLPPFELGADSRLLAQRLAQRGISLRTSPQARTSRPHDGRPACANFGNCNVCPIGARYSPAVHLARALQTGRCHLQTNTSVRRLITDGRGAVRAVVYQENDSKRTVEHPVKAVILAAGAIESARLLLLSSDARHPQGLGNLGGHLGRHLMFHHIWSAHLDFREALYPGRSGPEMGQSRQFMDPERRGEHGGVLLQIPSRWNQEAHPRPAEIQTGREALDLMQQWIRCQAVWFHGESAPDARKYIVLSRERDRFGDPFAAVHYESSEFDFQTHAFSERLLDQVADATGARDRGIEDRLDYSNGFHHMGGCRMSETPDDGVVDAEAGVHGTRNLFVTGGAVFPTCGAAHPTLTMAALAIRLARLPALVG